MVQPKQAVPPPAIAMTKLTTIPKTGPTKTNPVGKKTCGMAFSSYLKIKNCLHIHCRLTDGWPSQCGTNRFCCICYTQEPAQHWVPAWHCPSVFTSSPLCLHRDCLWRGRLPGVLFATMSLSQQLASPIVDGQCWRRWGFSTGSLYISSVTYCFCNSQWIVHHTAGTSAGSGLPSIRHVQPNAAVSWGAWPQYWWPPQCPGLECFRWSHSSIFWWWCTGSTD